MPDFIDISGTDIRYQNAASKWVNQPVKMNSEYLSQFT